MLDVLIANDRKSIGEAAVARDLFGDPSAGNPALATVYEDLGDALLVRFDAACAWRSWVEGRRLFPKARSFVEVTQFEQSLAKNDPDYF